MRNLRNSISLISNPKSKTSKHLRYNSDREIYAPAKLIRSKKSTSLLGLVPARFYHPFPASIDVNIIC